MNKPFAIRRDLSARVVVGAPFDAVVAAQQVAKAAREHARTLDDDTSFPSDDIRALSETGLLVAPLPARHGGVGLGTEGRSNATLAQVLICLGASSLPLGRLYEGHVNALKLVLAYGGEAQIEWIGQLVNRGELLGVWNTETNDGTRLVGTGEDRHLEGRKVFCSGAGHIRYPLITARTERGDMLMVVPQVDDTTRADLSGWTPHGMRASASGAVNFSGLAIDDRQVIGGHDDFHAQPMFSAGAWRFAAVQTGGIAAVLDCARAHLVATGRQNAPQQRARMGTAMLAFQSARQWVLEAARLADDASVDAAARVSHVNLARSAVERAGLDVLELTQRSVGLAGLQRTHPMERLGRDLATYLRQPNPDGALDAAAEFVLSATTPVADLFPWR